MKNTQLRIKTSGTLQDNSAENDRNRVLPNGSEKSVPAGSAAPIFTGTAIVIGEEKYTIEN